MHLLSSHSIVFRWYQRGRQLVQPTLLELTRQSLLRQGQQAQPVRHQSIEVFLRYGLHRRSLKFLRLIGLIFLFIATPLSFLR